MIIGSERLLMTKLATTLIILAAIGAEFAGNRAVNIVTGLLLIAVGAYMIVRTVRLHKNGAH